MRPEAIPEMPRPPASIQEMTFEQLIDWAAAYLLTHLIAGRFRTGVWLVLQTAIKWKEMQDVAKKKKPRR